MSNVMVDTGPLAAFLVETDSHHAWAVERFQELLALFSPENFAAEIQLEGSLP